MNFELMKIFGNCNQTAINGTYDIASLYKGLNGPMPNIVCASLKMHAITSGHVPINWLMLVDVSGSMWKRIVALRKCLQDLFSVSASRVDEIKKRDPVLGSALPLMGKGDTLTIVTFEDVARVILTTTKINEQSEYEIMQKLGEMVGDGGTTIAGGLTEAAGLLKKMDSTNPTFLVLVTDGEDSAFEDMMMGQEVPEFMKTIKEFNACIPLIIGIGSGTDIKSLSLFKERIGRGDIICKEDDKIGESMTMLVGAITRLIKAPVDVQYSVTFVPCTEEGSLDAVRDAKLLDPTEIIRVMAFNDERRSIPIPIEAPTDFTGVAVVKADITCYGESVGTMRLELNSWDVADVMQLDCITAACDYYAAKTAKRASNKINERAVKQAADELNEGVRTMSDLRDMASKNGNRTLTEEEYVYITGAMENLARVKTRVESSGASARVLTDVSRIVSNGRTGSCQMASDFDMCDI